MHIESVNNPRVKRLVQLATKAKARNAEGVFVVEGAREVSRAVACGYALRELWTTKPNDIADTLIKHAAQFYSCTPSVFEKIAYRESVADVVAVFEMKNFTLQNLNLPENPIVAVLDAVEKPGNLGAILRTCDALGVHAVLVCDMAVDIYNPNVIRNSLGAFFNVPTVVASRQEVVSFCQEQNIGLFATHLEAAVPYTTPDYTLGTAIVLGSEAMGISDFWLDKTKQNIIIKMNGVADSLNVSVAAAIVLAEVVRQRA